MMLSHSLNVLLRPIRLKHRLFSSVSNGSFSIPIVDFSGFREATSLQGRRKVATDIVSAFKDSGFVYLSGHGIPSATIQKTFEKSAEFFSLPIEIKQRLKWEDPRSNRGYVEIGRERVTQSADLEEIAVLREKAPDYKETMEIGRDWDAEWKNQWPLEKEAPLFKKRMLEFYETCHNLHIDVMRSIAIGLDLEENFFDSKINDQCHNLRLLSYPPVKSNLLEKDGQARAGAHSDYGTLTLLFQDSVGGLEVQNSHNGVFVPATPIPGTIIINVGDLLARWSNDVLRSTLHRVVAPSAKRVDISGDLIPARQSIAFFCNPNFNTEVSCLPNCGEKPKYPPINAGAYIVGRLAVTYT